MSIDVLIAGGELARGSFYEYVEWPFFLLFGTRLPLFNINYVAIFQFLNVLKRTGEILLLSYIADSVGEKII